MNEDDMDVAFAADEDDDCGRDDGCKQSKCKHGQRSSKLSRYRANEADSHQRRLLDITRDKPIKVVVRVVLPVRDHPKFNFVGKLLGPKGNSLKRLQEETMTKMAILGRGSMRDRHKEEELRISGDPRFSHLSDELHVEVTAFAPPAEAHARIAYALSEVRRFLVPDYNDEIRQEQMWEMRVLNGSSSPNDDNNNSRSNHNNNSDNSNDNNNNNDKNNDHNSTNKNVELRSSGGILEKCADQLISCQAKCWPMSSLQSRLGSSTPTKINGQTDASLELPERPSSALTASIPLLAPAPTPAPLPLPALSPTSTLALVQHTAARGSKTKSVAFTSSSLPANLTMVGRKRPLLGGGGYGTGTRLFMSPTKRTVLSILARAEAAQTKQFVSRYAPHTHLSASDVRVSSNLSDRLTLFVNS